MSALALVKSQEKTQFDSDTTISEFIDTKSKLVILPVPKRRSTDKHLQVRPLALQGHTYQVKTGCGTMYVILNMLGNSLHEILIKNGKAGGCASAQCDLVGRLLTTAVKNNIPMAEVVKDISGISCHVPVMSHGRMIKSCADGIASAIHDFLSEELKQIETTQKSILDTELKCAIGE